MHYNFKTKYYFINNFNTKIIDKLDKLTVVIYRNYSKINHNKLLILTMKNYCKKKGLKFYLANNIKLAIQLNLDGVYIPSFNKNLNHLSYSIKNKFDVVGSAHNLKEIKIKELQRVNKIFISSIFKKNKNYMGIYRFKLTSKLTFKKVVALGGISTKNEKILNFFKISDFAGISYFE
tara:strand:- start:15 stop:545 length:531 start_codon:yes stop_codon:yes gene_type:complete